MRGARCGDPAGEESHRTPGLWLALRPHAAAVRQLPRAAARTWRGLLPSVGAVAGRSFPAVQCPRGCGRVLWPGARANHRCLGTLPRGPFGNVALGGPSSWGPLCQGREGHLLQPRVLWGWCRPGERTVGSLCIRHGTVASWVGPNGFRAVCLSRLHVPDFTVIGLSFPQGKDGAPGPKVQTLFPTGTGRGVELSPRGPRAGRVAQALAVGVALALWDPGQVPVLGHGRPPCLGPHCCVHDPPTGGPRSPRGSSPMGGPGGLSGNRRARPRRRHRGSCPV